MDVLDSIFFFESSDDESCPSAVGHEDNEDEEVTIVKIK